MIEVDRAGRGRGKSPSDDERFETIVGTFHSSSSLSEALLELIVEAFSILDGGVGRFIRAGGSPRPEYLEKP